MTNLLERTFRAVRLRRSGQTLAEYGLVLSLVAVATLAILIITGNNVFALYSSALDSILAVL